VSRVFSVGHSSRTLGGFLELLGASGVTRAVDVRRVPYSRRHPWFSRVALGRALEEAGIAYHWLGDRLGGRQPERHPPERSPNGALAEPFLRHYADALPTPGFRDGLRELEALARERVTVLFCAEKDWHRCHRQVLCDWLALRGFRVEHLVGPARREPHRVNGFARLVEGDLRYPPLL